MPVPDIYLPNYMGCAVLHDDLPYSYVDTDYGTPVKFEDDDTAWIDTLFSSIANGVTDIGAWSCCMHAVSLMTAHNPQEIDGTTIEEYPGTPTDIFTATKDGELRMAGEQGSSYGTVYIYINGQFIQSGGGYWPTHAVALQLLVGDTVSISITDNTTDPGIFTTRFCPYVYP